MMICLSPYVGLSRALTSFGERSPAAASPSTSERKSPTMSYRTFLIQYRHKDARYAVTVLAQSEEDAAERAVALRLTAKPLLNAPHINRTVDSLSIDTWNAAIRTVVAHLDKLTLEPQGLPVSDPMLVAPIVQALSHQISSRFGIITPKEITPPKERD